MARRFLLLFCLSWQLVACVNDPDTTPAAVVKQYQAFIDQNEFENAAQLSTPAEAIRLRELERMIAADADSTILYTSFEQINCQEIRPDTVACKCELSDQYETYSAVFTLVKRNHQWLVDIPRPETIEYDSDTESINKSLQQKLLEEN